MREIPSLQSLGFRAVGSHSCSAEDTFCPMHLGDQTKPSDEKEGNDKNRKPSVASRLLRSFHEKNIQLTRIPSIGVVRRHNANQVDLHHPFVACRQVDDKQKEDTTNANEATSKPILVAQYGNPALDVLQSFIDSLVELGRMDDNRLGRHFFTEFKANILAAASAHPQKIAPAESSPPRPTKKPRRSQRASTPTKEAEGSLPPPLASLSLYNCSVGRDTLEALVQSGLGSHLAVLDLTGVNGLTDDLCTMVLQATPNLQRFSVKNCRRLSIQALKALVGGKKKSARSSCANSLVCLDAGGCFNITASELLHDVIAYLPALCGLHASGLGWTDELIQELVQHEIAYRGLSFGFSPPQLTMQGLRCLLASSAATLISLSLPFCESLVDNALMGMLGRNFPALEFLDLRGNPSLYTVTGWYDGRASADLPAQRLCVLGRYSSISAASVEETKRVHPIETVELVVVLDGGGMGLAIPTR